MPNVDVQGMPPPADESDEPVTAERRSSTAQIVAQQAAIAQIGQRALEERSLETLLRETCERIARVLDADLTSIAELARDGTSLRIVAGTGWRSGIVGELVLGAGAESMAGLTLASGQPVIADDFATETRFRVADSLREHGAAAGMSVRIGGASEPYGTLAVFTASPGRFTHEDVDFVQALANVLAAAIGRLQVENELRGSRDQLAAIVSSIGEGITVQGPSGLLYANDEAARLTGFESGAQLTSASSSVLARFELFDEAGQPLSPDALPGRRAMRGEDPPEIVVGFRIKETGETHWSVVRSIALRDANGQATSVINIFREVTGERWEQEARSYMADALAVLSSTLETGKAAQRLADLSVPRLADYCTVSLVQPDGSVRLVALAHVNPERVELIRRLEQMLPAVDLHATQGVGRVVREGIVETGEVTPELIDSLPFAEEPRALLRELQLRSYISVPLSGRRGRIGALSLVMSESGRSLGEREVTLAQELGTRAGIALENATLYEAAEARRAELDAVLAALAEAVLVFDASGTRRLHNQAATRTFSGVLPQSLDELWSRVTLDSQGDVDATPGNGADGEPVEVELDRRGQWLELRRYRAPAGAADGGGAPIVIVLRDINDVRAARAARDAFMGVLSHELRTPITTIYGGSELLERGLDDERRAEVIADIRAESERLARLVEDLLVMTRVERGIVEIADEPILLQHLLASVIASSANRWPGARIELKSADRLPAVRGDATYIEQVVRNLLTNAMRYGRGAESGVDVVTRQQDEFVVVRVLDNGAGFGGEDPERLFELFYRTPSARAVPGGAGIGLFVCRNLIEKMGGRVWAEERPEGGAEFGFSLPVLETEAGV